MTILKITWHDAGRKPQWPPNLAYPSGIDIDLSRGAQATCSAPLPYPAKRCGAFFVECSACGQNALISTAGRPDDPRSVKFACKRPGIVS